MKEVEESAELQTIDRRSVVRAQSTDGVAPARAISESFETDVAPAKLIRIASSQMRRNLVRNLRQGSVNDLSEQAAELSKVLQTKSLPHDLAIRWAELRDVLSEASMLREPSAALSVARGNRGRNGAILNAIRSKGGSIDRRRILDALASSTSTELSDSHLSHALTQMENANLLRREKHGNSVVVTITELGDEVLRDQSITPKPQPQLASPRSNLLLLVNQHPPIATTSSIKRPETQAA